MSDAARELRARFDTFMLGKANEDTLKKEALEDNDLGTNTNVDRDGNVLIYRQSPAGRHAMRGIPLLPTSGTQPDTDPLAALLHKESGNRDRFGDPPPREDTP